MHKFLVTALLAVSFTACASHPDKIASAYISPMQYQYLSCNEIAEEMTRVSSRLSFLYADLKKERKADNVQMGVGVVLFWPALFFLEGGDGAEAQEFAKLKGEFDALDKAALEGACDRTQLPENPLHRTDEVTQKEVTLPSENEDAGMY